MSSDSLAWDIDGYGSEDGALEFFENLICTGGFPSIPDLEDTAHVAPVGTESPAQARWCPAQENASVHTTGSSVDVCSSTVSNNGTGVSQPVAANTTAGHVKPRKSGKRSIQSLEKNRVAQKKFREKQKDKMTEMEQEVERLQQRLLAMSTEKTSMQRQNEVLTQLVDQRQHQIDALTEIVHLHEGSAEDGMCGATGSGEVTRPNGLEPGLTVAACRLMKQSEIVARWKSYVERMAVLLLEAEQPNTSKRCEEDLALVHRQAGSFTRTLGIANPEAVKLLVISNLDSGGTEESKAEEDNTYWAKQVADLTLTEAQQGKILYLAGRLMRQAKATSLQRAELDGDLQSSVPYTYGAKKDITSAIAMYNALTGLRKNLASESLAWTSFVAIVMSEVLTPLQFARFATTSYPLYPNIYQVAKHVVALSRSCVAEEALGAMRDLMPASAADLYASGLFSQDVKHVVPAVGKDREVVHGGLKCLTTGLVSSDAPQGVS